MWFLLGASNRKKTTKRSRSLHWWWWFIVICSTTTSTKQETSKKFLVKRNFTNCLFSITTEKFDKCWISIWVSKAGFLDFFFFIFFVRNWNFGDFCASTIPQISPSSIFYVHGAQTIFFLRLDTKWNFYLERRIF